MAQKKQPYPIPVKVGETHYFCKCGLSKNLPHCDGSHEEVGVQPMVEDFDKNKTVYICSCFKSKKRPFCDGTHNLL